MELEPIPEKEPDMAVLDLGKPDRDLADEFRALQEQTSTMPSGRSVRPNRDEPFYGALSTSELQFLANPAGSLAVHIVHAKNLNTDIVSRIFPTSTLLDYYVRVDFLEHSCYSKVCVDVERTFRRVIFDELVTFSIDDIAINEKAETQNVVFSLIGIDEQDSQRHITIGSSEKPLLSFVHGMIGSEVILLTRPARSNPVDGTEEGQWAMGTLLIKSAFAYGRFGYGYSNQVFDERMSPCDAIKHSLFPRFLPPSARVQSAGGVMKTKPLPPTKLVQELGDPSDIGHPVLRLDLESAEDEDMAIYEAIPLRNPRLENIRDTSNEYLTEKVKRLRAMKGASRRVAYLKELCAPQPVSQLADVFGQEVMGENAWGTQ